MFKLRIFFTVNTVANDHGPFNKFVPDFGWVHLKCLSYKLL